MRLFFLLLLGLAVLTACNKKCVDPADHLTEIKTGMTYDDVISIVGAPTEQLNRPANKLMISYWESKCSRTDAGNIRHFLFVRFDHKSKKVIRRGVAQNKISE